MSFPAICSPVCEHGVCAEPDTCDCSATGFSGPTCSQRKIPELFPALLHFYLAPNSKAFFFLSPAVCSTPCQNGGVCIEPETCDCSAVTGYEGPYCADR